MRPKALVSTAVLAVVLTACSTGGTADTTTTPAAVGETTTSVSGTKVNANTASASEIAAALTAAGVSNADRWAREVLEYRPYDTTDPDLSHLRDELQKYNPGQEVIDAIVSVLEP